MDSFRAALPRSSTFVAQGAYQPDFHIKGDKAAPREAPAAPAPSHPMPLRVAAELYRSAEALLLVGAGIASWMVVDLAGQSLPLGDLLMASLIAAGATTSLLRNEHGYAAETLLDPRLVTDSMVPAIAVGTAAMAICLLVLGGRDLATFGGALAWGATAVAMVVGLRGGMASHLRGRSLRGAFARRVAVVGATESGRGFIEQSTDDPAIHLVGLYDDRHTRVPASVAGLPVRGTVADLVAHGRREKLDAVVVALPDAEPDRMLDVREALSSMVADVYVTSVSGPAALETAMTQLGAAPVALVDRKPMDEWDCFCKAAFDRLVGTALFLAVLPLMLLIAAAIRLDSPGPVILRQRRDGFNNTLFTIFKFRTMVHGKRSHEDPLQATQGDSRVTGIGAILRRLSLDELPQLFNVVRGDMSLVGPRPHLPTTRVGDRLFSDLVPRYARRHRVKPGITGWAQVNGFRGETRTVEMIEKRVAMDLHYIENWSLWLDVKILLRTVLTEIVSRSGRAY